MNLTDYKNTVIAAIRADVDLDAWCKEKFNKGVAVFVGVDEENPPSEKQAPCVELFNPGKHTGSGAPVKEYQYGAVCTIFDESDVSYADPLIYEKAGVDRVEVFREMIQKIMTSTLPGSASAGELLVENPPQEVASLFQSGMSFIIIEEHLCGAGIDPFE